LQVTMMKTNRATNALNSGKTERFGRCLACEGFSVDLTC
jgi:hypothetical protein